MSYSTVSPEDQPLRRVVHVERQGRVKYTYYDDGIVKITRYRALKRIYWGRVIIATIVFALLAMGIVQTFKAAAEALKGDRTEISSNTDMPAAHSTASADKLSSVKDIPEESEPEPDSEAESQSEADIFDNSSDYSGIDLKVCLDPGHGDYDRGAVSDDQSVVECEQNLEIALLMRDYLESCGVTVIMTRDSDVQLSISERCSLANQAGADFYISLHRNSVSGDPTQSGVEIWINNKQPEYDSKLAYNILAALESVGISQNRGVKPGYSGLPEQNYQVNTDTVMPSCLLELGFVTNGADNQLFYNKKAEYAKAMGDAVIQTAIELYVVSEDGERLLNEQLISTDKNSVTVNY